MKTLICMTLALAALTTNALAEERGDGPTPCRADIKTYCKDVEPGGGRIMKCMAAHKDELSDSCKGFLKDRREQRQGRAGKDDRGHDDNAKDAEE